MPWFVKLVVSQKNPLIPEGSQGSQANPSESPPRIELRQLEAETLEDETRRLQDEKEERVKRLETLNAQAGKQTGTRYQKKRGPAVVGKGILLGMKYYPVIWRL